MITVTYLDACPKCPPGDAPAAPPIGPALDVNGGKVTDHQCVVCKTAWSTFWREGWPIDRLIAPVSAGQASRNRDVLASAVKGRAAA